MQYFHMDPKSAAAISVLDDTGNNSARHLKHSENVNHHPGRATQHLRPEDIQQYVMQYQNLQN